MILRGKLKPALVAILAAAALLLIFLAWRQSGLMMLQLDMGVC